GADELPGGALQDTDDPADGVETGTVGPAGEAHQNLVAGGGVEAVLLADAHLGADLALDGVGPDVADACAGAAEGAGDGAVRRGGADGVVLADLDPAVGEQAAQGALELGVLRRGDAELARQGPGLERLVAAPLEEGED